ncbi:MAG TPA: methyltransferase domain-containing protein [Gammaproteobacteria bacterium]|nr:methyltransferase domain-containing protein [Gammaproteobacteria bacterium]
MMDHVEEIDINEIVEQIREKIRVHQQEFSRLDVAGPLSDGPTATDLASLQSSYDIYHINFTSHRKALGRLVVSAKQVLRKLLTPILERQSTYNAANARVTSYLCKQLERVLQQQVAALQVMRMEVADQVERMRQQQAAALRALQAQLEGLGQQQAIAFEALREAVAEQIGGLGQHHTVALQTLRQTLFSHLERRANEICDSVAARDARLTELERMRLQLQTNLTMQERRLNILLEEARKRLPEPFSREHLQVMGEEERHALDAFFVSFEDQFRGSRDAIKERLRVYLPILKEAKLGIAQKTILDTGCGRGEWLELLKEQGLQAQGVDTNRVLVERCRQQGLEVIERDALEYLRSLPDTSLGAVTGFHLIEHLPFDVVIKLLDETVRVLQPGVVAIFETPNPENVLVGSYTFYLDPTHRNPLPSVVAKFIGEARGLCRVEIMHLNPFPDAFKVEEAGLDVARRFNEYFYGPQDYALVGWKA